MFAGFASSEFRVAMLTPPPAQAPHSSLVHMFDIVRREVGRAEDVFVGRVGADGAWALDVDAAIQPSWPR